MAENEEHIQELEEAFPKIAGAAFAAARAEALRSGLSVIESSEGAIYEVFPDGTRRFLKSVEAGTPVVPGTRFVIS